MANNTDLKFNLLVGVVGAQAVTDLKNRIDGVTVSSRSVVSALKTLATGFAVQQAASFVKGLIDAGDELQALSEKTGISVRALDGFKGAAEQANLPFEGLVGSLKKFSVNLTTVNQDSSAVGNALRSVGVSATDTAGKLRPSGDVIKDLSDKFAKLKDGPEKAAIAVRLFGKSGTDLIPFLNQGSEALSKFGLGIGDDFAARADQFNDSISAIINSLKGVAVQGVGELLPTLQEVLNAFKNAPSDTAGVITGFEILGEAIRILSIGFVTFKDAFVNGVDVIATGARILFERLSFVFERISDTLSTRTAQIRQIAALNFDEATRIGERFRKDSLQKDKEFLDKSSQLESDFLKRSEARIRNTVNTANSLSKNSLLFGQGSIDEIRARQQNSTAVPSRPSSLSSPSLGSLDTAGVKKLQDELNAAKAYKESQLEQIEIEKLNAQAFNFSSAELKKLTESKKIDIDVTRSTKNFTKEGAEAYREAAEAVKAQKLALIDLQEEQRRSFTAGAKDALKDYIEAAQDVASQTKQAFGNAFKGIEDALVTFVTTGKLSFKDLATSILADLTRIAVKQALVAGILSLIPGGQFSGGGGGVGGARAFASGGIMTARGEVPLKKYATGGVANSPQLALFGEGRQPEAFVPLPDGRRIPVNLQGSGEGSGGVSVNVVVNVDKGSENVQSSSDSGKQLGALIANAVKTEIIQQKRPGGLLA